jgi:hypothetical protein
VNPAYLVPDANLAAVPPVKLLSLVVYPNPVPLQVVGAELGLA